MDVHEIAPGLWRWTAPHPDWKPSDAEAGDGWEQDVGCVYLEAADATVLIDPLIPAATADRERFLKHLDADVERRGRPVAILLTTESHRRSAPELAERYGAETLVPPAGSQTTLPGGVAALDAVFEVALWIPAHAALVTGDILLGAGDSELRVCPDPWLVPCSPADARERLRPLLDLPVERILVTHGEPVLDGAHAALARALST